MSKQHIVGMAVVGCNLVFNEVKISTVVYCDGVLNLMKLNK